MLGILLACVAAVGMILAVGHPGTALHALDAFVEALKIAGNVSEACELSGAARTTVYRHRESDPDFAKAWDEACDIAWDRLEREAYRRAAEGWDEPVYQGGKLVGHVRKFSDRMLEITLRAKRAREYRESKETTVHVDNRSVVIQPGLDAVAGLMRDPAKREVLRAVLREVAAPEALPAQVVDVKPETNGKSNGHQNGNGRE